MEDGLETAVEHVDGVAIIHIAGDLTAAAQEQLDAACTAAIDGGPRGVVVAFREVDHINSAGIGILIGLVMACRETDLAVRFAHPSSHFRKIFDIVGLSRYVEVSPVLDEALAAFS